MKKITIALLATSVLLGCLSCDKDFHEVYAPDELGVPESEFYVDAEGGDVEIEFLANKVGDIYLVEPEDASWAQIIGGTFEADGTVKVHIQPNAGFRRSADIRLETPTRKVTVTVFQEGGGRGQVLCRGKLHGGLQRSGRPQYRTYRHRSAP